MKAKKQPASELPLFAPDPPPVTVPCFDCDPPVRIDRRYISQHRFQKHPVRYREYKQWLSDTDMKLQQMIWWNRE